MGREAALTWGDQILNSLGLLRRPSGMNPLTTGA